MTDQTGTSLKHIVEGLIFAADEPITPKQVRELIEGESENGSPGTGVLTPQRIRELVDELNDDYERYDRPYRIRAVAEGYIFATNRDVSAYVGKLHKEQSRRRLSQAALETLAIIAYKQPMTKVELETIRGVNSDYIVRSLLEKDLIAIVGREPTPGRPLLYGTTKRFLMHFGLNSINELPKPREIEELIGETELEVEKRLLEMQKQKQDDEDETSRKRERKPHPLSDGAIAKIIPLKPDYRPVKKQKPEPEEDAQDIPAASEEKHGEPPETQESTGIPGPEDRGPAKEPVIEPEPEPEHEEPVITETVEQEPVGESYSEPVPEQVLPGDKSSEQKEDRAERGWKKWKNKIVTIIRKIFG